MTDPLTDIFDRAFALRDSKGLDITIERAELAPLAKRFFEALCDPHNTSPVAIERQITEGRIKLYGVTVRVAA